MATLKDKNDISQALLSIVERLYCCKSSQEFRRPVIAAHPSIAVDYLTHIKHPEDLGTILHDIIVYRQLSLSSQNSDASNTTTDGRIKELEILTRLKRLFSNCIAYNQDTNPHIVSQAAHVDSYAEALWMEYFPHTPYRDLLNLSGTPPNQFRSESRQHRLELVKDTLLSHEEFKQCILMLQSIAGRNKVAENIFNQCTQFLQSIAVCDGKYRLSIKQIFLEIIESCLQDENDSGSLVFRSPLVALLPTIQKPNLHISNDNSDAPTSPVSSMMLTGDTGVTSDPITMEKSIESTQQTTHSETTFTNNNNNITVSIPQKWVRRDCLSILADIESFISRLSTSVYERRTRGNAYSTIYALPTRIVWAKVLHQSGGGSGGGSGGSNGERARFTWWAAAVIAGGPETPPSISAINIQRTPLSTQRELNRLRARSSSTNNQGGLELDHKRFLSSQVPAGGLTVPDGYYLVEFFQSHDFGWVKYDNIMEFQPNQSYPSPRCHNDAIVEANMALELMRSQMIDAPNSINQSFSGFAKSENLHPIPSMALLKAEIAVQYPDPSVILAAIARLRGLEPKTGMESVSSGPMAPVSSPLTNIASNIQNVQTNTQKGFSLSPELVARFANMTSVRDKSILATAEYFRWLTAKLSSTDHGGLATNNATGNSKSHANRLATPSTTMVTPQKELSSVHSAMLSAFKVDSIVSNFDENNHYNNFDDDDHKNMASLFTAGNSNTTNANSRKRKSGILTSGVEKSELVESASKKTLRIIDADDEEKDGDDRGDRQADKSEGPSITMTLQAISGRSTSFLNGDCLIHSRSIESKSPVFFKESKNREIRKQTIRSEIARLRELIDKVKMDSGDHYSSSGTTHKRKPSVFVAYKKCVPNSKLEVYTPMKMDPDMTPHTIIDTQSSFHSEVSSDVQKKPISTMPALKGKVGMIAKLMKKKSNVNVGNNSGSLGLAMMGNAGDGNTQLSGFETISNENSNGSEEVMETMEDDNME